MTTTTLDADSTVEEIFEVYQITPSETDLTAWSELDLPTTAATL